MNKQKLTKEQRKKLALKDYVKDEQQAYEKYQEECKKIDLEEDLK